MNIFENILKDKLKCYTWLGIVFVLIMGTLAHFVYEWTDRNFIAGLFTPVNESTWEHMKLVFFPMLIYSVFIGNRLSKEYPCILSSFCIGILLGTWLIAILFYAYSGILGFNVFILDLAVFIASVLIAFKTSYKLTLSNICCQIPKIKIILFVLIILMAICFMIYSFNPLSIGLFREP